MAEIVEDPEGNEFSVDGVAELLIDPVVERDKIGRFVIANFSSFESLVYPKSKAVRPKMSDWAHLSFGNVMIGSLYVLSPFFIRSCYNLGKLMGYFTAQQMISKNPTSKVLSLLKQAGITWELVENPKIQGFIKDGWMQSGGGRIDFIGVDSTKHRVVINLKDGASTILSHMKDPYCHFELGVFCGQMESLLGGRWDGIEAACVGKGDECCSFQLTRDGQWDSNLLPLIPRQEAEIVLTRFLDIALSDEKDFKRRNISNFQHISTLQALNYIILTRSAGHGVLLKYAGKAVGKRIAAEKKLHSTQAALKYLTNLFTDLKVGIMEADHREGCIVITLKESIMSAGVANIKAKLCGYIAGIIEGCIDAATDQCWVVEEEKCVAAGDPACVFSCSMRKTPVKQVLLIR